MKKWPILVVGGVFAAWFSGNADVVDPTQTQTNASGHDAIAVAFNKGNASFARMAPTFEQAAQEAMTACVESSANPFRCEVKARVDAGTAWCVDYGAVTEIERVPQYRAPDDYRIVSSEYFINFTQDASEPNKATEACMATGRHEASECASQFFTRRCNF